LPLVTDRNRNKKFSHILSPDINEVNGVSVRFPSSTKRVPQKSYTDLIYPVRGEGFQVGLDAGAAGVGTGDGEGAEGAVLPLGHRLS
jgi:hypothetical protein